MTDTDHMRVTAITIPWADGEFTFDLRLGEVRALQLKTGLGVPALLRNLQSENYKVDDFRETILQGLLGGGMPIEKVRPMIKAWVDNRPARENVIPAISILLAWLVGVPERKNPVAVEVESGTQGTEPGDSISPQSMEQVPQSDSVPAT